MIKIKIFILTYSLFLLFITLDGLRKYLGDKNKFEESIEESKKQEYFLKDAINENITYILINFSTIIWLIFYSITINILYPSLLAILGIFLGIFCIVNHFKITIIYKKKGLSFDRKITDIPIYIIKCAYILAFIVIYSLS